MSPVLLVSIVPGMLMLARKAKYFYRKLIWQIIIRSLLLVSTVPLSSDRQTKLLHCRDHIKLMHFAQTLWFEDFEVFTFWKRYDSDILNLQLEQSVIGELTKKFKDRRASYIGNKINLFYFRLESIVLTGTSVTNTGLSWLLCCRNLHTVIMPGFFQGITPKGVALLLNGIPRYEYFYCSTATLYT